MTKFVLIADGAENAARVLIDSTDPGDDRLDLLQRFLDSTGIRQLSTSHQCHAVSGPDNPHFEIALRAYGLVWLKPRDEKIIEQAMEMLVASTVLDQEMLSDQCLRNALSVSLASEEDWANIVRSVDSAVRTFLGNHYDGFEGNPLELDQERLTAYSALAGGTLVAVSHARADWTV